MGDDKYDYRSLRRDPRRRQQQQQQQRKLHQLLQLLRGPGPEQRHHHQCHQRRVQSHADGVHRGAFRHTEHGDGGRQHYGDGLLQDRQAAANHQQLLPVQFGGGGRYRGPVLDAALYRVHRDGVLAVGCAYMRRLAGGRLYRV